MRMAEKRDSVFEPTALDDMEDLFGNLAESTTPDANGVDRRSLDIAGNGRFVRNLVERSEEEREYRLDHSDADDFTDEELMTITAEDVRNSARTAAQGSRLDGARVTEARGARSDPDRRSFTSRTPANENPDRVEYRRGFVTRHQVSGWRFVMRRIASGVALHDTRMLVDPLRTQSARRDHRRPHRDHRPDRLLPVLLHPPVGGSAATIPSSPTGRPPRSTSRSASSCTRCST